MGYMAAAIKGISWMTLLQGSSRAITFLKTIILARVLTPAQYGFFGIASLLLSLLEILTETGINVFLIQQKEEIGKYIHAAWIVSILRGILISLVILLSAGTIATYFNAPEAYPLIVLMSVVPLLRGFINPSEIKYQKELNFRFEVNLRLILIVIEAGFGVLLTFIMQNPIGLIWGTIISVAVEVIYSLQFMTPKPRFVFELDKIRTIFRHGKWITAYGVFNYFSLEGDNLVVGKILGPASLGIYDMAYNISTLPVTEITNVVSRVVFPIFAKVSDDKKRLLLIYIKSTFLVAVPAFILSLIIFCFPYQIVQFILGEKWSSAAEILRLLVIYGFLRSVFGYASSLFLGVGKQTYAAAMTFTRCVVLLITIVPLVLLYGLQGAALSVILSVLVEIPVIIYFWRKIFVR